MVDVGKDFIMVHETKLKADKGAFLGGDGMVTNPELAAYEASVLQKKNQEILATGYGPVQEYLHSQLRDMNLRVAGYELNLKALKEQEAEAKELVDEISTRLITRFEPITNKHPELNMPADLDAAAEKLRDIKEAIADLKKPFALPDAEVLQGLVRFAARMDAEIHTGNKSTYQLQNWDKLPPATQEYYFKKLSAQHKAEHDNALNDSKANALRDQYNNFHPSEPVYSVKEKKTGDVHSEKPFEMSLGMQEHFMMQYLSYKPLELNSPEFYEYIAARAAKANQEVAKVVDVAKGTIDVQRGIYPRNLMTSAEIDAEMDKMWDGFKTRTEINLAVGVAGGFLTSPLAAGAARTALPFEGSVISNVLPKVLSVAAKPLPAIEVTGFGLVSATTGVSALELIAAKTALSSMVEVVVPQAVTSVVTKAGGVVSIIGASVVLEGGADFSLSQACEGRSDFSISKNIMAAREAKDGEIEEMAKAAVYKDVHDPFSWLALKAGYEKPLVDQCKILLSGEPIESLCRTAEQVENSLKHKPETSTKESLATNDSIAYSRTIEKFFEQLKVQYEDNRILAREHQKQQQEKQPPAAETPAVLASTEAVSPINVKQNINNNSNSIANIGNADTIQGR